MSFVSGARLLICLHSYTGYKGIEAINQNNKGGFCT